MDQLVEITETSTGEENMRFRLDWAIDRFMARYDFRTMLDSQEIYVKIFEKGYFEEFGELTINSELSRFENINDFIILAKYRTKLIKEIKLRTLTDRQSFAEHKYPEWINLCNGSLNVLTMEFIPHNLTKEDFNSLNEWQKYDEFQQKFMFLTYIDLSYDKNVICNHFDNFLKQILPDEQDRNTIYEWFGYCLLNDYPIQKALLLIGPGANGKSTLMAVLRKFLGTKNVTGVSLYELMKNRFAPAELYTRKANIQGDLAHKLLRDTAIFKKLTGGDLITAEKKNKDPFEFLNTAKIIITCNQVFMLKEEEETFAFFRRWNLINFPVIFAEKDQIPQTELLEKIANPCELSGILNKSLEALKRLLENKRFSNQELVDDIAKKWIKLSNSVKWFWTDLVSKGSEEDKGEDYEKLKLKETYNQICQKENIPEQSLSYFSRIATELGYTKGYRTKNKIRKEYFFNIHFNNGYSNILEQSLVDNSLQEKKKDFNEIFSSKPKILDFLPQIRHYLMMEAREHEDGDIDIKKFKQQMISTYKYEEDQLEEVLENLAEEGEIYAPRPGIIRLSDN